MRPNPRFNTIVGSTPHCGLEDAREIGMQRSRWADATEYLIGIENPKICCRCELRHIAFGAVRSYLGHDSGAKPFIIKGRELIPPFPQTVWHCRLGY